MEKYVTYLNRNKKDDMNSQTFCKICKNDVVSPKASKLFQNLFIAFKSILILFHIKITTFCCLLLNRKEYQILNL